MMAQLAIAFELRFVEPLVGRGLVWKRRLLGAVTEHVGGLVTAQRRFDIDQRSGGGFFTESFIVYGADRAMPAAELARRLPSDAVDVNLDIDPHIGAALAYRVPQVFEAEVTVLIGIARDDIAAPATHQLVNTQ